MDRRGREGDRTDDQAMLTRRRKTRHDPRVAIGGRRQQVNTAVSAMMELVNEPTPTDRANDRRRRAGAQKA